MQSAKMEIIRVGENGATNHDDTTVCMLSSAFVTPAFPAEREKMCVRISNRDVLVEHPHAPFFFEAMNIPTRRGGTRFFIHLAGQS